LAIIREVRNSYQQVSQVQITSWLLEEGALNLGNRRIEPLSFLEIAIP
jgi:hypothetical protein